MGRAGLLLVCWADRIFLEWSSPKHNGLELVEWSFESGAAFDGVEGSQTAPSLGHHEPTSTL